MSSGWPRLDPPENIVELTVPWLTDPVCLWVREKVEELVWYHEGLGWACGTLEKKEGRLSQEKLSTRWLNMGVYVQWVKLKILACIDKD